LAFLVIGHDHIDLKDCLTDFQLITVVQIVVETGPGKHFGRKFLMGGSTDLHPVERSAIETPGVPDADRGWIDIEQAMLSRNAQEARFMRQSNFTVLPPTDAEPTRTVQFVGLAHEDAVLDLEDVMLTPPPLPLTV
jgi:hypothetical protein